MRVVGGACEILGGELGRKHARRKERDGSDTRARASRERETCCVGGDGLTGGANLAERGKWARLREEWRRQMGLVWQ